MALERGFRKWMRCLLRDLGDEGLQWPEGLQGLRVLRGLRGNGDEFLARGFRGLKGMGY